MGGKIASIGEPPDITGITVGKDVNMRGVPHHITNDIPSIARVRSSGAEAG